jgi:hypothetical protein
MGDRDAIDTHPAGGKVLAEPLGHSEECVCGAP